MEEEVSLKGEEDPSLRPECQFKGFTFGVINGEPSKVCFLSFKGCDINRSAFLKDDPGCGVDNGLEGRRLGNEAGDR